MARIYANSAEARDYVRNLARHLKNRKGKWARYGLCLEGTLKLNEECFSQVTLPLAICLEIGSPAPKERPLYKGSQIGSLSDSEIFCGYRCAKQERREECAGHRAVREVRDLFPKRFAAH